MARDGKMDVHLDVSQEGFAGRLDVIAGPSGRRRRSDEDKARIVAESLMAGVRVADVARRHGMTRWQVYDWRRRVRDGRLALPDRMISAPAFAALVVEEPRQRSASAAGLEIVVGDVVIRAAPGVDERHLSRVIRAVRAAI
ncbi:MAG: IS66-like element accessory protein TnpA [Microbacteriaceae bacterium]